MSDDVLDRIFAISEKEAETFAEVLEKENIKGGFTANEVVQISKTADFTTQKQGWIQIVHGFHEKHYAWHIRPWHQKKPWSVPIAKVIYAIGSILNEHFPHEVIIDIYPPASDWDIAEITVRANDAKDCWAVTDYCLNKVTGQFFEILDSLV